MQRVPRYIISLRLGLAFLFVTWLFCGDSEERKNGNEEEKKNKGNRKSGRMRRKMEKEESETELDCQVSSSCLHLISIFFRPFFR